MAAHFSFAITRRSVLLGAAGTAAAGALSKTGVASVAVREIRLAAGPSRWPLVGKGRPEANVWCYDSRIPGPEIKIRQREPVRIVVENRLSEDTTVHWHGIRLPNSMDGVPGLTQPPIKPGDKFVYEFTPPDAGTFWYHPHADSLRQLGRGLAGALIVSEAASVSVDRDILWMLADWRLTPDAQIAPGFGNAMEAAMSGRVGNTVTLNGAIPTDEHVRAGERVRLRLVNSALARIMALRFEGHRPVVVAIDGQPCDPHEPKAGRVLLGPAMRIDLILDMQGEPGKRYRVIDDFYPELSYWLTNLTYGKEPPVRAHPLDAQVILPGNPLPQPDLTTAERHELKLQGGMMSGMGGMMGSGGMMGGGMMGGGMNGTGGMMGMSGGATWSINGTSMTGDGHANMQPLLTLTRGRTYILTLRNETAWWHPMHLHGHSFRVLSRNGDSVPNKEWADTVLVPPKETADIAFVADNPGDWMLHCHVTDHQVSGLMTVLRVT
ncbi:MAG TPA: multicopper oxidase family protein [Pseudolabrys sp.]|nr:multicopper oxidase family protein [Pseudolabrys sp.]